MNDFLNEYLKALNEIKKLRPMVHQITNFVTMQDCANITVAVGASPIMAYFEEEVEEIVSLSSALVLNTGTPEPNRIKASLKAGKKANELSIPIVLDPVGMSVSRFRRQSLEALLNCVKPSIIKGNVSEIKALIGLKLNENKGVDSEDIFEESIKEKIMEKARELKIVIAVTGKTDFVTDGVRLCEIKRGSKMLSFISGSGCMTSSLTGSFCGVMEDYFLASVFGILTMNFAGELSEKKLSFPEGAGMFKVKLFDYVYNMNRIKTLDMEGVYFA